MHVMFRFFDFLDIYIGFAVFLLTVFYRRRLFLTMRISTQRTAPAIYVDLSVLFAYTQHLYLQRGWSILRVFFSAASIMQRGV